MRIIHRLSGVAGLVLASACVADLPPRPAPMVVAPPPAAQPAPPLVAPPATSVAATDEPVPQDRPSAPIEAEDPQTAQLVLRLRQEMNVRNQQARHTADELYREALAREAATDLEGARRAVRAALEADPGHIEAQRLKDRLDNMLTTGPAVRGRGQVQQLVEEWRVRIQQAELEVLRHIRTGERHMAARQFSEAKQEFEAAAFKIRSVPFAYPPLEQLLPHVERALAEARHGRQDQEARLEQIRRREAEQDARLREEAERREVLNYIAQRLEMAYLLFDQGRYDQCIRVLDRILQIDPNYRVARELKEDALAVRHRQMNARFAREKIRAWKEMILNGGEAVIPYADTVRFPSREEWRMISERALEEETRALQQQVEEEEVDLLAGRLENMIIDLNAEDLPLRDALAVLREQTGIPILLDPSAERRLSADHRTVRLSLSRVSAGAVLRLMLQPFGLACRAHPDGYLLIGFPEQVAPRPVVRVYDVADLVARGEDAAPPDMWLASPEQAGESAWLREIMEARHGPTSHRDALRSRVEDLVGLIRQNVSPASWDRHGTSIRTTPNLQLLVVQTPHVQDELREFLSRLRSYTGTMVSVTARFIAAYDDFLSDVGVDWIRRPPTQPYLFANLLPDNANATGSDVADPSDQLGVGLVIQEQARMEYYDLRGSAFHTFRGGRIGDAEFDLGRRITNTGGLGMAVQILARELAAQMILRAVEKTNKATIVQAPRITMFNAQRAHIAVIQSTAYIADYNPAVAAAAGALDPVIAILQTGVVLDVQPIVSNDRRYVTLELRPTLAELQTMRQVQLTRVLTEQGLMPLNVQLPHVLLQRAQATVQVPDQGSVLLSGFRDIFYRDVKSEIPFLAKIPIVGFFFERHGKSNEQRHLLILVTPEIIDMQERETLTF